MPQTPKPITSTLSRYWLLLGVAALAIAGLFALVLVIARTPSLSDIPLFTRLFHESLVVHVDLSVLVWFLAVACMMWSLLTASRPPIIPCLEEAALISFALGTLAIAASPLDSKGEALMSNYIPVITSPVFFLGLGLLMCGVGLMLVKVLLPLPLGEYRGEGIATRISPNPLPKGEGIYLATVSSALIALIAIVAFCWSFAQMPGDITPKTVGTQYYELLFWGGGHVLQFLHTQILLVCWLILALTLKPGFAIGRMMKKVILCIGPATVLIVPAAYLLYRVTSMEQRDFFTQTMIWGNGIAPALLAFYIAVALWQTRNAKNALWTALAMSVLVFIYGGVLGEIIRGQNVIIPAHYHGAIVGITLAFMGAAYLLLPMFSYRDVRNWKMAFWQPVIYGSGQILHISGLAWSGGYGVLRKTPGGMDALAPGIKAAMGLMGLGGLIAIIGGLLFVLIMAKAVYNGSPRMN